MNRSVLIVDDDKKIRDLMDFHLQKQGYETHSVSTGKEALTYMNEHHPAAVLLDIHLADSSGMDILNSIEKKSDSKIIMITGNADVQTAVRCMKLGAYDFVTKPIVFSELDQKVKQIFNSFFRPCTQAAGYKKQLTNYKNKCLISKSPKMAKIFEAIDIASQSDVNVLIEGESGTGKELVARAIHESGPHAAKPFLPVNCGAIPENLLESELFGHERGAFTGAVMRKVGKFESAQDGTIFLDEIGDLTPELQVKLLRVIQEKEIERLGGSQPIDIKARFIVATHRDLKKLVSEGTFREDLFFRVNVFPIQIPPLRERKEDVPELLQYFIQKYRGSKSELKIAQPALERLIDYAWPGNVREVENFIERMYLMKKDNEPVLETDLEVLEQPAGNGKMQDRKSTEKIMLENAIKECGGNISKASKMMNISRDTFYRKIKQYEIAH